MTLQAHGNNSPSASASSRRLFPLKRFAGNLIRRTGYTVARAEKRTSLVCTNIPGWFSVEEAEALYMLVAGSSATRILEIGHFLGRSTSAICEALRDSGLSAEFNSYDLGFTSSEEFIAHFERVHDTASHEVPPEYVDLVYSKNKTTTEIAEIHLQRFGLDGFVHLVSGDFTLADKTPYDLIFCDALHDHGEIVFNLPHVMSASAQNCVWAFHDMTSQNVAHVLELSNARLLRVVDTLGIFRFRHQA